MSSCFGGAGGRAYGFELEIVKPTSAPSSSTSSSRSSSSPSSTLSESSNSVLAISTKKARTPRKRPNQTYTEAAALLARIYPKIFSAKSLRSHCRLAKPRDYLVESSELLPPFPGLADAGFLLGGPPAEPPVCSVFELKAAGSVAKCCWSPVGSDLREPSSPPCIDDDFDAESILDEEMGEGLDSILGNSNSADDCDAPVTYADRIDPYLGYQPGSMYGLNITSALKRVGNGDWWCSPTVEIHNILSKPPPPPEKPASAKTKKKKKLVNLEEKTATAPEAANPSSKCDAEDPTSSSSSPRPKSSAACLKPALSLNLNLERVLKEWADGGSPFSELPDSSESPTDIIAKLSDIDLFSETAGTSGMREASVLRYKEKRRSRLFSKKIRYQVRKVNAEVRPRMKANGRFVKKDDEED